MSHNGEPVISVIVPTFDRVDLLRRCLCALSRQSVARTEYEVIVVDNNCTDTTAQTVRRLAGDFPNIRYLFEPRQGISHAKNAGLAAAAGSIVCYTDDDAMPCRDWLAAIAAGFGRGQPGPDVVGGPALPLFTGRRPAWYRESYDTFSWGATPRLLGRHECFYGLNVAYRRDLLVQAGGFDTRLGMKGDALGFAEDDEVFERLWVCVGGNLRAYYEPAAFVRHAIPDSRTKLAYRLKRELVAGQARFALQQALGDCDMRLRRSAPAVRAGLVASRALIRAAAALPRSSAPANWVVESGGQVAERVGFFLAAVGGQAGAPRPE